MQRLLLLLAAQLAFAHCALQPASAATITILNNDGAGEGFNDPTPVASLPNNPGTTLGAQRLNVFTAAANQWGAQLDSPVTIVVRAQFDAQTCTAESAVLGSAGPVSALRDFAEAPLADTWYVVAEANALIRSDQDPASPDINATFNSAIDSSCLGGVVGWYYGLDQAQPIPGDRIALLPVVFHELAHGLGFISLTDGATGQLFNGGTGRGRPDAWAHFLSDTNLGGTAWADMTNNQRRASAIDDPFLAWGGPNVTALATSYLDPQAVCTVNAPASFTGIYVAQPASYGPAPPLGGFRDVVAAALDTGTSTTDGCEPITNAAQVAGRIALVDRGNCEFVVKTANAQAAGAVAVLVASDVVSSLPPMGGTDPSNTIVIPSYGISQGLGAAMRNALGAGVDVTLGYSMLQVAGGSFTNVRLHAPSTFEPGSSISHFSIDATPNLLMEPSLNEDLFSDIDLTVALFRDIGWPLLPQPNKAPTLFPASEFAVAQDSPSPLTDISFADADAGTGYLTLQLQVDGGTILLTPVGSVNTTGAGTANVTLQGTRADLLAYVIAGFVRYLTPPGSNADQQLTITVNDNGNSGTGGPRTATANATIVVTAAAANLFFDGFE